MPPLPGEKPVETYDKFRKRLILYVEGELILGVPPGVIARSVVESSQGEAHDLLIEVDRVVLYRVADPLATPPLISGLEEIIAILDSEFGQEEDLIEEDAMESWENHWRTPGTTMRSFISEETRKYKKAQRHAQLAVSDSYRSKRVMERSRVTK